MDIVNLVPYSLIENEVYKDKVKIQITKATLKDAVFQNGKFTFSFESCLFFNSVTMEINEEIDFENISLSFSNCYINYFELLENVLDTFSLHFLSSIITARIQNERLKYVSFNNCYIVGNVFLLDANSVYIYYSTENLNPYRWKRLLRCIGINNYEKYKTFISRKQSYYISSCATINFHSNSKIENLSPRFNVSLSISYGFNKPDIYTKVSNFILRSLSITGNSSGKVFIENIKVEDWYLHDYSSQQETSFYNIDNCKSMPLGKIGIHKCNLDNVWFDNVNLDNFSVISLYRTKFSKTIFTSCNFPESFAKFEKFSPIENVHYPNGKKRGYYKDQYEIFLQLKKSLESTGNYYEAQKLLSISHDALMRIEGLSLSDKIILSFNSISNKHGLSIKAPFLGFLISTVLLYIFYLGTLRRIFNANEIDWNLIGYYFSFVDLTHRTDFLVQKNELNGLSLTFDYLNKVVAGFFIYQFIAAFRKYGKK